MTTVTLPIVHEFNLDCLDMILGVVMFGKRNTENDNGNNINMSIQMGKENEIMYSNSCKFSYQ